jgi:hypothetical protein
MRYAMYLDTNGDGFFIFPSIYFHKANVSETKRTAYVDVGMVIGPWALVFVYYPKWRKP